MNLREEYMTTEFNPGGRIQDKNQRTSINPATRSWGGVAVAVIGALVVVGMFYSMREAD